MHFKNAILFLGLSALLVSCDKEPISIGSEIFGEPTYSFQKYRATSMSSKIVASGVSSTKNLNVNALGVFHDVFGTVQAHFVSQVELQSGKTLSAIGDNPVLDSVYVYIPYLAQNAKGDSKSFELLNVEGKGKFALEVYENGYFLKDTNPSNATESQQYFSDQFIDFERNKKGLAGGLALNNSEDVSQNTFFEAKSSEILLYKYDSKGVAVKNASGDKEVKERKRPGIWLDLDKSYFQKRFFDSKLYKSITDNVLLKQQFRGLFFKAKEFQQDNLMLSLDLSQGEMVFVYHVNDSKDAKVRKRETLTFGLGRSEEKNKTKNNLTVNLFENKMSQTYSDALKGTSNDLWIKGNTGSIVDITVLSAEEIKQIKDKGWMINQAMLTVCVNKNVLASEDYPQPQRLYLYDLKNNMPIVDYTNDASTVPLKAKYNGILDVSSEKDVVKYRFSITEHLQNLISKDSTNVHLGLVAVSDVTKIHMVPVKNSTSALKKLPMAAASFPFGTVIHNEKSSEEKQKMKLEIYYTEIKK